MARRIAQLIVLIAVAGLAVQVRAANKIDLKWKPLSGKYVSIATSESISKIKVGERVIEKKTKTTMETSVIIEDADAQGNRKLTSQVDRVYQRQSDVAETVSFEYDSDKPVGDSPMARTLAATFGPIIKRPSVLTLTADNKVVATDSSDPVSILAAKDMNRINDNLPGKPVGVGDEWSSGTTADLFMAGKTNVASTCKLKAIEDEGKTAVVEIKVGMETVPTSKPDTGDQKQPGAGVGGGMAMRQQGVMRIDLNNPMLVTITGAAKGVTDKGGADNEFSVKTTVKVELAKPEKAAGPGESRPLKAAGPVQAPASAPVP